MQETCLEHELIIAEVKNIRIKHPRMGGRKLYQKLEAFMLGHQIKLGRDGLFDLLSMNSLLVRRRKRRVHTTNSFHWLHKYPNLIKGFLPKAPNQLWVSDITYWKIGSGNVYISLVTDAFSHKIIGYQAAETLAAIESVEALKMALATLQTPMGHLIHHSDRGIQYCSSAYVNLLRGHDIQISMTENGDPLENALAERVNGIIKEEYLECYPVAGIKEAKALLKGAVGLYNEERPHMSIGNMTPDEVHQNNHGTERLWKNYHKSKGQIV